MKEVRAFQDEVCKYLQKLWSVSGYEEGAEFYDRPYSVTSTELESLAKKASKHSNIKKFHISNLKRMNFNDSIPVTVTPYNLASTYFIDEESNKWEYFVRAKTGIFVAELSAKGEVVGHAIYACWLAEEVGQMYDVLLISEDNFKLLQKEIYYADKKKTIKQEKPKNGIFSISVVESNGVQRIVYKDISDNITKKEPIHPVKENILESINYFFDVVPELVEAGENGVMKSLLAGVPGSGKTSTLMSIAKVHSNNKCIVFATSLLAIAMHCELAAKHDVPSIGFLEDGEGELRDANGSVLNWLNGYNQPVSKSGIYIIITSNKPKSIEDRISKRPGRIDEHFIMNAIKGEHALTCAEMYMSRYMPKDTNYKEMFDDTFDGFTGAVISNIANATLRVAIIEAGSREKAISLIDREFVLKVIENYRKMLEQFDDVEIESTNMYKTTKSLGFR